MLLDASNHYIGPHVATPAPKKILIVEDESDIAQLVQLYLEKEGFRTMTALTGIEGLAGSRPTVPIWSFWISCSPRLMY
jgi:PleD family two-component response regulator